MRLILTSLSILFFLPSLAFGQIPINTQIEIAKAEDARRYNKKLEDMLRSPSGDVRSRAALAAGRIGNDAAIPALTNLLENDPLLGVREMAAFALGETESINATDAILGALTPAVDPKRTVVTMSPGLGSRLLEAAGKIAAANPTHAKAENLRAKILEVLRDQESGVVPQQREIVLLGLTAALRAAPRDAKRERPDDTDVIVGKYLRHQNGRIRADAANTLARVRAKNVNDVLRAMVSSDRDPIARANAARALAAAEDKAAVDVLIKAATTDVDSRVRVSAIRALATIRDPKSAEPLLERGESILAQYKLAKKPDFIPEQQNEFIEIATALGRVLVNTRNERAVNLFRQFGDMDRGFSTEVYLARLRIAPGRGDDKEPQLVDWRQYSTLAQLIGEFSALEPTDEEGKRMKAEAPGVLQPLAGAYAEADPVKDADTIMAGPEVLRAYAKFKPNDLSSVLRKALSNQDLFIRATAAELLGEQPMSQENFDALARALDYAIVNDTRYNDAVLSTIDALVKLDKKRSLPVVAVAAGSLDQLVRAKIIELLKDDELKDPAGLPPLLRNLDMMHLREVRPYAGKGTKSGQILNSDADYRRALSRKNGTVRAVLTTQKGAFTIELLPEDAPLTVDNFIKLARSKYFNGLTVHRVVPNFVMQDGDPRGDGNGGPGWSIRCEMNMVPYERGAVGMALSGKDTGGSQWFVTHSPQPHLDGGYTVFGRVNEIGMKVVDKIVRGDKIVSVRIVEAGSTQRSPRTRR